MIRVNQQNLILAIFSRGGYIKILLMRLIFKFTLSNKCYLHTNNTQTETENTNNK